MADTTASNEYKRSNMQDFWNTDWNLMYWKLNRKSENRFIQETKLLYRKRLSLRTEKNLFGRVNTSSYPIT